LRFDPQSSAHLLLSPERGLLLSPSAAQVVLSCDGERSILEIARELAAGADMQPVLRDVLEFLGELRRRNLVELVGPEARVAGGPDR
jgi:pyrroloquinoline quinone biosynthesis protein D